MSFSYCSLNYVSAAKWEFLFLSECGFVIYVSLSYSNMGTLLCSIYKLLAVGLLLSLLVYSAFRLDFIEFYSTAPMEDPFDYYTDNSDYASFAEEDDNSDHASFAEEDDNSDHASFAEEDDNSDRASFAEEEVSSVKPQQFRFLNQQDMRQLMEEDISNISRLLSLSKSQACLVLRYFNWSVTKVQDFWFGNESEILQKIGLLIEPQIELQREPDSVCGICFDSFSDNEINSAICGHPYCKECWTGYLTCSINNDGLACLSLRCPEPSCAAAICKDMIESLVSKEDRDKYNQWWIRSYIEESKTRKYCPGANCEYAIEAIELELDRSSFDLTCSSCFTSFCWNCSEEGHRPMDCDTVKKWILNNGMNLDANLSYRLAFCKPCPKCNSPIEKDGGCMFMTCTVCRYQFCWICRQGHHYGNPVCNVYINTEFEGKKKDMAKENLKKYVHYFERWNVNRQSKLKAAADLQELKNKHFKKLSENLGISEACFDFITDAWKQVVESRRILEWSYAFGFYLPEDEMNKKRFFEYLQGEAESGLEKLHDLVETMLQHFLSHENCSREFAGYRERVIQLTVVTKNYFEKLVKALENGLSEVKDDSHEDRGVTNIEAGWSVVPMRRRKLFV